MGSKKFWKDRVRTMSFVHDGIQSKHSWLVERPKSSSHPGSFFIISTISSQSVVKQQITHFARRARPGRVEFIKVISATSTGSKGEHNNVLPRKPMNFNNQKSRASKQDDVQEIVNQSKSKMPTEDQIKSTSAEPPNPLHQYHPVEQKNMTAASCLPPCRSCEPMSFTNPLVRRMKKRQNKKKKEKRKANDYHYFKRTFRFYPATY